MKSDNKKVSKVNIGKIMDELSRLYPQAGCSLVHESPIQLLVNTQLSAQCTDKRVNMVSPLLYEKYPGVSELAAARQVDIEKIIKPLGFFRNKARNIIACCKMIEEKFAGNVPDNIEDMLTLPGVGRKTANLVLWELYGIPGVIVDTHAGRLSKRLGLTESDNPDIIEKDVMSIVPKEKWSIFSHLLVHHGRNVCMARKPQCERCTISPYCLYYKKQNA